MNKFISIIFVFFLFTLSLLLPKSSLLETVSGSETKMFSVIQERLGIENTTCNYTMKGDKVTGETLEISASQITIAKLLDLLGARVQDVQTLSSFLIINATSNLIPYKNVDEGYNLQIKVSSEKIVVASPRFIN